MRNLKKILAAITVIAMLASMMVVPALAEGFKYEEEAKILNELKLMEGMGLGDSVNRLQGLIFAIKAAGKKDEVDAMTDEEAAAILAEKVVDADEVPAWGVKWTAYAVEKGFTSGVDASVAPKVKFAPLQEVSATSFLVWIMNIGMGYNFGTDVVVSEAVNANVISLSQAMEIGAKAAITRDDAAGILYGACKNGVNADGKSFIQSLIDAGVVTEEAAIAAGLVEAKPEVLEVVSVSADNLKQIKVEFNVPIKEAGDEDNYIIETDDAKATIDEDSDFALQDDKKTVVITLTEAAAQQEVIDLTIKDIESEGGLKLKETTIEDIELFDNTIPKAVSASVAGKYTIKVVFSEPVVPGNSDDPDEYFSVDDGDYLIESIEMLNNNTEINVTLYSALEEGTVEIEAKPAIKDFAGFGIPKKSFTLDVVEDETGPVVVGYKNAKPTEVTLIFDEDIKLLEEPNEDSEGNKTYAGDTEFLANFYHTNKNNPATDLKASGKELTIKFTEEDGQLPEGRAYLYIEKEVLQDLWENKNAKISYVIEVELDEEPPVIDKVEQDKEDSLKLTFNEELDRDSAEDIDNYTILDNKGNVVKDIIDDAELIEENKVVKITFNEDIYGDYSIVVQKVKDLAGNAMSKTTVAFSMADKTAPNSTADNKFTAKIYNAGEKGQLLKVNFNDTMATDGKYSVLDLDKYEIDVYTSAGEFVKSVCLADVKGTTIKIVENGKAVEIKVPSDEDVKKDDPEEYEDYLNITAYCELYISKVADAAGNKTPGILNHVDITGAGHVGIKDADAVALTAKDTITITLNDRLSTFKSDDFKESITTTSGDSVAVSRIRHTVNSDGNSVITLTLKEWDKTTSGLVFTVSDAASKNAYGETVEDMVETVVDKAAPEVDKVVYVSTTTIKVILTEAIDGRTVAEGKNGFSVSGGNAELTKAEVAGNVVTLTGKNFRDTTDVSYNDVFGLADEDGNAMKSFSKTDKLDRE